MSKLKQLKIDLNFNQYEIFKSYLDFQIFISVSFKVLTR